MGAGALLDLADGVLDAADLAAADLDEAGEQSAARKVFAVRLVETPGVVSTVAAGAGVDGVSLVVEARRPAVPPKIVEALRLLRSTWAIAGEELEDAAALARVAGQISSGFHYKWRWPGGIVDEEWKEARAAWHKEVRDFLVHRSRRGLDSPLLLANAAMRASGEIKTDGPVWPSDCWGAWSKVRRRYPGGLPVDAVWIDDFLVRDAVGWAGAVAAAGERGIVWYGESADAWGRAVAAAGGLPLFSGGGDSARLSVLDAADAPLIVCSVKAHGEGKNLQGWQRAYVAQPAPAGADWEQLLGRQHRDGQVGDEVRFEACAHTWELTQALERALVDADYIEETTRQEQKLTLATRVGWGER